MFYVVYGATPKGFSVSRSKYRFDGIPDELKISSYGPTSNPEIRGDISDPPDLNYLRNVIGFITWCLDSDSIAVFDPQMFKWWIPSEWMEWIFDPAAAVPRHHVFILTSEDENGTEWFHTRGMRKFGRRQISLMPELTRRESSSLLS